MKTNDPKGSTSRRHPLGVAFRVIFGLIFGSIGLGIGIGIAQAIAMGVFPSTRT